jgi:photosystem II stability/assembly factor-like uncharacterized protein
MVRVQALDPEHVFVLAPQGVIFGTTNGGRDWRQISRLETSFGGIYSFWFSSPEFGFALCSEGLVIRTADGGLSWTRPGAGVSATDVCDLFFASGHNHNKERNSHLMAEIGE